MDVFEDMTSAVVLPDGIQLESGLGFIVGAFLGEKAIGHVGHTSGFAAFLINFPEKDFTIVILTNTIPSDPYAISNLIALILEIIEIK
jgi:CubicO group peptidase (beta-lactamase class C family)